MRYFPLLDLYKRLWFALNKVFPRRLWTQTVDALMDTEAAGGDVRRRRKATQEDLLLDPLQVCLL